MNVRITFFALLLAVLGLLSALIVEPFLGYLLASVLLAFVLHPLHRRLAPTVGARLSAFALVLGTVLVVAAPLVVAAGIVATQADTILEGAGDAQPVQTVDATLERFFGFDLPVETLAGSAPGRVSDLLFGSGLQLFGTGIHAVLGVLLAVFLLYYLLKDGDDLVDWTRRMTPLSAEAQDELYEATEEMTWAVLKGHVLVAAVQGAVAGLGLFVTGVPNAAFWTAVMIVLALVPVIGVAPVLGGAAIYLLLSNQPLEAGFVVVYGMTVVAVTDDYLRALVVDRGSSLHSGAILIGVFGAVYVLGAIGLFVGPIILGLFKAAVEVFDEHYVG